jgi:D-aminoacyl-tRNA deacylase
MRLVIQRVKQASVVVNHLTVGKIGKGILVLLGIGKEDNEQNAIALVNKLIELRIFEDNVGKMNLSAKEVDAGFLIVSQFTLYGDCMKGRRPSFDQAASPAAAEALYNFFVQEIRKSNVHVETGQFRAMMDVHLINDGPVTFILEN